ncbi:MAG: DMT family transporter [Thermodesulfobacteriota bacterium]
MEWIHLGIAIVTEVVGTLALKPACGFTKLWPSVMVVVGYGLSFYFMSLALRTLSVGLIYAIWAGAGVALISVIAWVLFGEKLDMPAIAGIVLILAGVIVIKAFSNSVVQ